jgi:hypothetical protein
LLTALSFLCLTLFTLDWISSGSCCEHPGCLAGASVTGKSKSGLERQRAWEAELAEWDRLPRILMNSLRETDFVQV